MSDSSALFKFLFLIFDVPNLHNSGVSLIPSSISYFPSTEFSAFAPMLIPLFGKPVNVRALTPSFAIFPKILPHFCVLRFLCYLDPVFRALVIVRFLGKFFMLTLLYLARKDCPFVNFTPCSVTHLLSKTFYLSISAAATSLFSKEYFFITGPAIALNACPSNDPNIAPTGKNPAFCVHLLRLPSLCQTTCLTGCFLILKSRRLAAICYKFYDVMSGLVLTKRTSTRLMNEPRLSALVFW